MEILSDPVHLRETLLAMNECLFLGRFIPEFGPLHCRVLRDIYHVYTADIHSIRCASVLARIAASDRRTPEEEEFLKIYERVPDKALLTLAILLHDIGKGKGHGHSRIGAEIVARIGARWGMKEDEISDLVFLVEQHLLMAHVSQRRDLHDIEMILSFAETVRTPARLDKLYLLTYADMKEVGPEVWTQWKAMLLNELYEKGRNVLEQGALKHPFEERAFARRSLVAERLKDEPDRSGERFIARVDDRYIIGTPDARFVDHCRLLARFDGKTPIVETIDTPGSGRVGVHRRLPGRARPLRQDRGNPVGQRGEHPERVDLHDARRSGAGHLLRELPGEEPPGGAEKGTGGRGPGGRPRRARCRWRPSSRSRGWGSS